MRGTTEIGDHNARLAAGNYWQVIENWGGLELLSLPCGICKARVRTDKVPENEVEYIGHVPDPRNNARHADNRLTMLDDWRVNGMNEETTRARNR